MRQFLGDIIVFALFCLLALFAFTAVARSQPAQAPPVVPMPPQAPPVKAAFPSFFDSNYFPVVVFVGTPPRSVPGITVCVEPLGFADSDRPCVIVFRTRKGGGERFPASMEDWQIIRAAGLEVTAQRPAFFQEPSNEAVAIADGNGPWLPVREQDRLKAIWPKSVEFPAGMRFYRPTERSQRIAVTGGMDTNQWYHKNRDDVWANAPTSFNPNRTDKRWVAPGGLADIRGWTHAPAILIPDQPRTFWQRIPIANGGMLPAKRWTFHEGTVAADLLMKDGKAFELRFAEKRNGQWERYVAFKDRDLRPNGYHGAGMACSECHDLAGTSEQYGITVRGCDGVFSFNPFD